jgi:NAD(P)H-hydrate epimerase
MKRRNWDETLILNRSQVRTVDAIAIEEFGIPGIVLMENAGRGCVDVLLDCDVKGPAVILCGPGNNGGDGFVIARHLKNLGLNLQVVLFGDPEKISGDARINLEIVQKMEIPISYIQPIWLDEEFQAAISSVDAEPTEWIIDALLGTGATGAVRAPMDQAIRLANELPVKRMAIDIPTGVDCDLGTIENVAFKSDITCTFVAGKPGLFVKSSAAYVGEVRVIDIGVPRRAIEIALTQ